MKDDILEVAGDQFMKLGYKSVTMDDLANEMGISKKTIYKFFKNKEILIEECVGKMQEKCHLIINSIVDENHSAIKEMFQIKKMFKEMFQNADTSPIYQLKKYYPKIHEKVMKEEMVVFNNCIKNNIERGIANGVYRNSIPVDSVVEFYRALVFYIHENIPMSLLPKTEIEALEYHVRAIATKKGINEINTQLQNVSF